MKINRNKQNIFVPIEIILESRDEAKAFRDIVSWARGSLFWTLEIEQLSEDFLSIIKGMIEKDA